MIIKYFLSLCFLLSVFSQTAEAEIYATISGYVIEEGTGNPIEGQTVSAAKKDGKKDYYTEAVTSKKGLYVLNVPSGSYTVSLKKSADYYADKRTVDVNVPIGKNIVNRNFKVKKAGYVSGRVFKEDGATPYANVTVSADVSQGGYQQYGTTDANGYYKIGGLPDFSNAAVVVIAPGVAAKLKDGIKIVGGQETKNIDFVVSKAASSLSIKGKVLSETLNEPIANIAILILGKKSFAQVSTDANGNFEVYGLPTGQYDVMIASGKYEYFGKKGLEIVEGATPLEMNFILKPKTSSQSKINEPSPLGFLSNIAQKLYSLDFSLVGDAYAANSCETCISCSSRKFDEIISKYEENAAQYSGSSIFSPYANALVCVSGNLHNSCNSFNSPGQLLDTMQCIQKKVIAHDSACWKDARNFCGTMEAWVNVEPDTIPFSSRAACTWAQAMCESEDRGACWSSWGFADKVRAGEEVIKCFPSIGYDSF